MSRHASLKAGTPSQCSMLVQQTSVPEVATCVVVGAQQLLRLAPLCPPACQLVSLAAAAVPSAAAKQQHAGQRHDAAAARVSIDSVHDILQLIIASQAADGASFVIAYAMKQQRALSLAERGFFPMTPTDGLCFLPLDLSRDLRPQLRGPLHAILHKVGGVLRIAKKQLEYS